MSTLANPTIRVARDQRRRAARARRTIPRSRTLRQRACTELLRQAAQRAGLLDRIGRAAASTARSARPPPRPSTPMLDRALQGARRRRTRRAGATSRPMRARTRPANALHAAAHPVRRDAGRRRRRAAQARRGRRCSTCSRRQATTLRGRGAHAVQLPDAAPHGGDLGWLVARRLRVRSSRRSVFVARGVGVLPRLVHSRFGFHVVEVLEREAGAVATVSKRCAARWPGRSSARRS